MKRIITTALTLTLMLFALGTGVYAWFTVNTRAEADGLTGSAEAIEDGFYLSLDGSTWTTKLDLSGVVQTGLAFTPLTTGAGLPDLKTLEDVAGKAHQDYVEFELHFLTGKNNNNVYLTEMLMQTATATSWVSEVTMASSTPNVNAGDILSAKLSSAMRVSLGDKIFENPVDTDLQTTGTNVGINNTLGTTGGFAWDYYQAIMGANTSAAPVNRTDLTVDTVIGNKLFTVPEASAINLDGLDASVYTNYGSLKVKVWLEGWDGEAFNAVASGIVDLSFKFEVRNA